MEIIDYFLSGRAIDRMVLLMLLLSVLVLGILLFISGTKIKKKSKATGIISRILGGMFILAALYFIFWVIFFGYNS